MKKYIVKIHPSPTIDAKHFEGVIDCSFSCINKGLLLALLFGIPSCQHLKNILRPSEAKSVSLVNYLKELQTVQKEKKEKNHPIVRKSSVDFMTGCPVTFKSVTDILI